MRTIHKILIGGIGTALLAGAAIAASHEHVMTVNLSDGQVARIAYVGDTAPKVQVVQKQPGRIAPTTDALSPFAEMDRISALMDARMDEMMRRVAMMQGQANAPANGAPRVVAFSNLPKGAQVQYSYTSTTVSADGCARSVSWSSNGSSDTPPKMVKTSSGSCGVAKDGTDAKPLTTSAQKSQETAPPHRI
jgi:hypothetical protein